MSSSSWTSERKPLILYMTTVSAEDLHVAGKERHGESIAHSNKRLRTHRPDQTLPTSWLSSTTQPSKPRSKPKVNTCLATSDKIQRPPPMWPLEYGFMRVRCEDCHHERLVAFSCKRRGFCPSCGARRMAECGAADRRSLPRSRFASGCSASFPATLLLARHPQLMGQVLSIVYRTLSTHLIKRAGCTKASDKLAQRSYPTLWLRARSQCPLPHAVSRWCLCRRWLCASNASIVSRHPLTMSSIRSLTPSAIASLAAWKSVGFGA